MFVLASTHKELQRDYSDSIRAHIALNAQINKLDRELSEIKGIERSQAQKLAAMFLNGSDYQHAMKWIREHG